jgi:arylsulfatase A-like enzyme
MSFFSEHRSKITKAAGVAGSATMSRLICLLFCATTSICAAADLKRPHIIFMMADDMGWGQTSYRNHPVLKTPHLDAMAANGLRCERFYAGNPVCSPTRACVLTGRTNERCGVLSHGYALRTQEKTIAQALKTVGYATAHFGKWHLNGLTGPGAPVLADDPRGPSAFGFDTWLSATNYIDMAPFLGRQGVPEQITGDSSEVIVREAGLLLEKQAQNKQPIFAVIWFGSPHAPFKASDADKAMFADLDEASANHYGELVALDRSVGLLRQKLRDLGMAENTLLVFNSDNGGLPEIQPATTGGLRGVKGQVYEGGLRVPGIIEWPAVIKPRVTSYPVCVLDLFPTVADIVGLPTSSFIQPVDGASIKPLFAAELGQREQALGFRFGQKIAFIKGRYKLVSDQRKQDKRFELYDLEADPNESQDLRQAQPERFAELKELWQRWDESVESSLQGKDYPEGKVSPPDPTPTPWTTAEPYQKYLPQWNSYWVYAEYLQTAESKRKRQSKLVQKIER